MKFNKRSFYPSRKNYVVYWLVVATLFLLLQEILISAIGESFSFGVRLSAAYGGISGIMIGITYLGHSFIATLKKLKPAIEPRLDRYEPPLVSYGAWVKVKTREIFTLRTATARIATILIAFAATVTILLVGVPISGAILNFALLITLIPFFLAGGYAAYSMTVLLGFVGEVVKFPVKVPFFAMNQSGIRDLSGFFMRTALIVLVFYLWLLLTAWLNPYGFTAPFQFWLLVLGFYPLAMFLWSSNKIHILMHRAKAKDVSLISAQVQDALFQLQATPSKDAAEQLSELMAIHRKVEGLREWPVSVGGILTVGITSLVPVINIALRLQGL